MFTARANALRAGSLPRSLPAHTLSARRMGANHTTAAVPEGLSAGCRGAPLQPGTKLPLPGTEEIMKQKAHGTCETPVQKNLRWGCDAQLADRICW